MVDFNLNYNYYNQISSIKGQSVQSLTNYFFDLSAPTLSVVNSAVILLSITKHSFIIIIIRYCVDASLARCNFEG